MPIDDFYPRSPCGERLFVGLLRTFASLFLSTLSLRRATKRICPLNSSIQNFYPRSPCGERRLTNAHNSPNNQISIHALLAESDVSRIRLSKYACHFYPRSPCGERLCAFVSLLGVFLFLSTLSLRRATQTGLTSVTNYKISIHALLAESDTHKRAQQPKQPNFYPRSPCGERHKINSSVNTADKISIHALLAESDCWNSRQATVHT